jgi:hypothetical protein
MSYSSEEIYREKYLKYKKKYITALENMKGGVGEITPKSVLYICPDTIYKTVEKNKSKYGKKNKCYTELFNSVSYGPSLVLTPSTFGSGYSLKTTLGDNIMDAPNPVLFKNKFGIVVKSGDKGKMEEVFDENRAKTQLKEADTLLSLCLRRLNPTNVNSSAHLIVVNNDEISLLGKLMDFADIQQGGGDATFYILNKAAVQRVNEQYGESYLTKPLTIKSANCFADILLSKSDEGLLPNPAYATIPANQKTMSMFRLNEQDDIDRSTHELQFSFGGEKKFYGTIFDDQTAKEQINPIKEKLKARFKLSDVNELTVLRLEGTTLQTFDYFHEIQDGLRKAKIEKEQAQAAAKTK